MGGEIVPPSFSLSEDESSVEQHFPHGSRRSTGYFSGFDDGLTWKLEDRSAVNGEKGSDFGEFSEVGCPISSRASVEERRRQRVYAQVLKSYEELQSRGEKLEAAKSKILSYTPGAWIGNVGGMNLEDYDVPNLTSILLIGPKGSGKSSLVNKISRVFEDGIYASERAQVSYNLSTEGGTRYLHEYIIPRGSGAFCLYDSCGLSDDSYENLKMVKHWMTKGVRHGELVTRKSGYVISKARFRSSKIPSQRRIVNFVIFVLNGLSILESLDGIDETKKQHTQMLSTIFNNPLLLFKDDKPVVVVTHGDLLSISDRVKIRIHLGELLCVPPTSQIFDIPESNDALTQLTILDMLFHCLEHADKNLRSKGRIRTKMQTFTRPGVCFLLLMVLSIGILYGHIHCTSPPAVGASSQTYQVDAPSEINVDWRAIRHLWMGLDDD